MKEFRHRYIAFKIFDPDRTRLSKPFLIKALIDKVKEIRDRPPGFRFRLIEYDPIICEGIVKVVPHTATESMKSLLISLKGTLGARVTILVLATSGTLKALRGKCYSFDDSTKNNNSGRSDISIERDEPAVPL